MHILGLLVRLCGKHIKPTWSLDSIVKRAWANLVLVSLVEQFLSWRNDLMYRYLGSWNLTCKVSARFCFWDWGNPPSEANNCNLVLSPEVMHDLHAFADDMVGNLPPEGEVALPDWRCIKHVQTYSDALYIHMCAFYMYVCIYMYIHNHILLVIWKYIVMDALFLPSPWNDIIRHCQEQLHALTSTNILDINGDT